MNTSTDVPPKNMSDPPLLSVPAEPTQHSAIQRCSPSSIEITKDRKSNGKAIERKSYKTFDNETIGISLYTR